MSGEKSREAIIQEAERMLKEIKQIFLDAAHWNNIHPDQKPIDPDPDGFLRHMAEILEGFFAREAERKAAARRMKEGK